MKKNLIKSLKNLLKAYGGENSNKNNAVQIIDEITETLGGETTSKSKNLVEAIDKLSNQVSESSGGSNPNRVQLVIGTYENLFDSVGLETLATALNNQQATAIILTASMLFASVYMDEESGKFAILATDFVYAPTTDDFSIPPSQLIWGNGYKFADGFSMYTWNPSTKKMKDVTQQYGQAQAVAVIIWHPLPDGSWPPF